MVKRNDLMGPDFDTQDDEYAKNADIIQKIVPANRTIRMGSTFRLSVNKNELRALSQAVQGAKFWSIAKVNDKGFAVISIEREPSTNLSSQMKIDMMNTAVGGKFQRVFSRQYNNE